MKIYSKKSLQFDHPKGADAAPPVVVQAGNFGIVPDWVRDSTMFKWADADGDVEVINSREDEIAVETGSGQTSRAKATAEAKAKKEAEAIKAKAAAEVTEKVNQFASLTDDEQIQFLQAQTIEPGANPEDRILQCTEWLQQRAAADPQQ